jgi:hypothetical protein
MDILTFIAKLIEHAAWPISAVIIGIVLRSPIEKLLSRLNKAKHKNTELDFNPDVQRVSSNIEGSSSIADAIPHDPLGLIQEAEQRIYSSLENLNIQSDSEKVKVLAKHHANLQIRGAYAEINHLIFGSQLALLQALNVQPQPVEPEFLVSFYESAKQQYPDFYETYSFEGYVNFLKTVGMVNTESGKYFITVLGRGFLMYLAESGSNMRRHY